MRSKAPTTTPTASPSWFRSWRGWPGRHGSPSLWGTVLRACPPGTTGDSLRTTVPSTKWVTIPFVYFGLEGHAGHHDPSDTFENLTSDFYLNAVETVLAFIEVVDRAAAGGCTRRIQAPRRCQEKGYAGTARIPLPSQSPSLPSRALNVDRFSSLGELPAPCKPRLLPI